MIAPAQAQSLPEPLTLSEQARVIEIIDADTIVLEDGRQVRLVGLQGPKLALGRPNFEDWPLAHEAAEFLAALVLEREIGLAFGETPEDRHGRLLAHIVRSDEELWIQGAMLAAGMARVYSFPDNRIAVAEMLALERAARAAGRGVWAHPYYAILPDDRVNSALNSFQIVEGVVHESAIVGGRAFLNYGPDWSRDFTVTVAPRDVRLFERAGIDLADLDGVRLRVRGWLNDRNGPQIVLTHPEQLEFVTE